MKEESSLVAEFTLTKIKGFRLRGESWKHMLLLGPLVAYLAVFYVYPLAGVLIQSVFDPEFTTEHYLAMLKYPVYLRVFWNTLQISIVVTLISILLGYPVAYFLSDSKSNWATILLIAVVLPFWISVLVRTYAWMIILGRYGVVNDLLRSLGLIQDPLRLMYNRLGVCVGMVYVMLPYAILPMLSVMQGIDRTLMRAADNLGSTPYQSFRHVFFPLSLPGVGAAFLLTFIICVGFFITPALMGSTRDTMVAMSIQSQLEEVSNWGFASALSVLLLVAVLILFYIYNRFLGLETLSGGNGENQLPPPSVDATGSKTPKVGIISRTWNTLWNEQRAFAFEEMLWRLQDHLDEFRASLYKAIPKFLLTIQWYRVGLITVCSLVFTFMIIPVLIVVPIAFSNEIILNFPPREWGFALIKGYFSSEVWMRTTLNSFRVAIPVMFFATFLGTLASLSLVRGKYRNKQSWYALFLLPIIVPWIISAVSFYFFFAKLKMIGTISGLVFAHTVLAVPYVVVVMTSTLKGFDERLEQASMSLGAGRVRTFFNITFPIIRPAIFTALLFSFIRSFDELITAMFISGVQAKTLPKQMWDGIRDEINPTIAAVAALLIFLTIFLMLLVAFLRRRQEQLYAQKQ
jgi:ABC-type spermidine/putrescine transport system permease subunit I